MRWYLRPLPLTFLAASLLAGDTGVPPAPPKPSANQGKAGIYRASTSHAGIGYWVCVPKSYSPANPAGLHVFLHGLGGQSMARTSWYLWNGDLLEGQNLIGINLEYTDGNPHDDKEGKAAAAREAVQQVMADYRVVAGRGVLAAFSAGGSPAGVYIAAYGRQAKEHGADWPFSHVAVYGAGLNCGPELVPLPTSWSRAMGDGEEAMAPGLIRYFARGTAANAADPGLMACQDAVLNATKGRGHTILPDDVRRTAETFARSSTVFAPYLCQAEFTDPVLAPVAALANRLRTADALAAAAKLGGEGGVRLRGLIQARVDAQVALLRRLATADPPLAVHYGDAVRQQVKGHAAAAKAVEDALAGVRKDEARWRSLRSAWAERLPKLFEDQGCVLKPEAVPYLKEVVATAGAGSSCGWMATKFLAFAPEGAPPKK